MKRKKWVWLDPISSRTGLVITKVGGQVEHTADRGVDMWQPISPPPRCRERGSGCVTFSLRSKASNVSTCCHVLHWEQPMENPGFVPSALGQQGKHPVVWKTIWSERQLRSQYQLFGLFLSFFLFSNFFKAVIKLTGLIIIGSTLWQVQYLFPSSGSWM